MPNVFTALLLSHFLFITGSPPPAITWSKLRAPLPWKHTVADGVLTLTNVGRQDSGQYICNATNVHGYSEAYTQMEVECKSTSGKNMPLRGFWFVPWYSRWDVCIHAEKSP